MNNFNALKPGSPQWITSTQQTMGKRWCWEMQQCDENTPYILTGIGVVFLIVLIVFVIIQEFKNKP